MSNEKRQIVNSIVGIAEAVDMSPATVSRVLNNHPHVTQKTRDKVLGMVKKVGYRRNGLAAGLRSNKTNIIGLIVPRISMFVHAEVITSIQNSLYQHQYNLIICQSNDQLELEKEQVRTLYAARVDAVIVACTLQTTDFEHFNIFLENDIPVVFYDRVPVKPYPVTVIKGDDEGGGYLATSHLIQRGCKKIAHITGTLQSNLYIDRYKGFKKAMKEHSLAVRKEWIISQELTAANAEKAMEKLFAHNPIPDALFAANDVTAFTALQWAMNKGIKVPGDFKIVGYSNDPRSSITSPSVTTIDQFPSRMGDVVVEKLMTILKPGREGKFPESPKPVVMPVQLIQRMST
ncbi:MAG TPA: LacI family DNA-binding transcriptional regulator [Chitinophagaceae bacterium]|nr:LacI family DNA-binding transcriptional regulator [Chitinophagaceae bacterium]